MQWEGRHESTGLPWRAVSDFALGSGTSTASQGHMLTGGHAAVEQGCGGQQGLAPENASPCTILRNTDFKRQHDGDREREKPGVGNPISVSLVATRTQALQ